MLKKVGIQLRNGRIWISQIRLQLPDLLDSWDELEHQRRMGSTDDEEEDIFP